MQLRDLAPQRKAAVFSGVLVALLLGALDNTIVGPAMPQVVRELGGMHLLAWVFTVYSLTSTIAVPITGKLSDLYGRKGFYLSGIGLFLLGSAMCAAAGLPLVQAVLGPLGLTPMLELVLSRGLQGVGGGMMMSNGMAIVGDLFEPRERGKYQGFTGAVFGLASVVGPALGGWLTDALSWRWIFLVNLPLGAVAMTVLWFAMPRPALGVEHEVDWWGAAALVAGLVPLLLALNWGGSVHGWLSSTVIGLLAAWAVMTVLFVARERRVSEPIIDVGLFADRSFAASMAVLFFSGVGMFGSVMFLPLFMQVVQGASAASSGSLLIPMMVAMVSGSIACGQVIARTGRYKRLGAGGLLVATAGMALLARIDAATTRPAVVAAMVLVGGGMGVTMPLFAIALQAQFQTRIGEVTAAVQFFRSIGGTVGVALLGGVMNGAFARNLERLVASHAARFGTLTPVLVAAAEEPSKLLNAGALNRLHAAVPPGMERAFATFVADMRIALADAIAQTFAIGALLMGLSFAMMLSVREVPLAAKVRSPGSLAEIGGELIAGEAVQPAEHEPVLVMVDDSELPGPSGSRGDGDGRPGR